MGGKGALDSIQETHQALPQEGGLGKQVLAERMKQCPDGLSGQKETVLGFEAGCPHVPGIFKHIPFTFKTTAKHTIQIRHSELQKP